MILYSINWIYLIVNINLIINIDLIFNYYLLILYSVNWMNIYFLWFKYFKIIKLGLNKILLFVVTHYLPVYRLIWNKWDINIYSFRGINIDLFNTSGTKQAKNKIKKWTKHECSGL